jgi:hypothetical protein
MKPLSSRSGKKTVQQRAEAKEARRKQDNERKTIAAFKNEFPDEKIEQDRGVPIASSRDRDADGYKNEIRDAQILQELGNYVILTPELRSNTDKKFDAFVNGLAYEFKNIHGNSPRTLRKRFLESREQAENVFINLEKSKLQRRQIIGILSGVRNGGDYKKYNKHKGGRIILKIRGVNHLIYLNVDDLKK